MSNQAGNMLGFNKAPASYQLTNLLEKMTSNDKDFRFMATNDLMVELEKDSFKFDQDTETKVVKMILKLLNDKNGEVQHIAIKCLGPLVKRVKEHQVETIVDSLCINMVSEQEQLRDISSMGLKTVIAELPLETSALATSVCQRITGRLNEVIETHENATVQLAAMDILSDVLARFGGLLPMYHEVILNVLLPQLSSQKLTIKKRAIGALNYLVMSCSATIYSKLIDFLVVAITNNPNISNVKTNMQCMASIWFRAGQRFGEHVESVVPLAEMYIDKDDDELKEHCINLFEALVRRCPKEILPHTEKIINFCLQYLKYDPNYCYDEKDEENPDDSDSSMGDDDDDLTDDEDYSWKVRRAAAKCCEAVITTRPKLLPELYKAMSPVLISCFRERQENVKSDIFHAYIALLKQTQPLLMVINDPDAMEQEEEPVCLLQTQVPAIVGAVQLQMKEKSIKTRQDCFTLLNELAIALPGALANHIPTLIPRIQFSLEQKNAQVSKVKIDALHFMNYILTSHPPELFSSYLHILVPMIISAVKDGFYKIVAEAVLVLEQLVKVIRPVEDTLPMSNSDSMNYISDIIQCTLPLLKATNIDQQVKERAISCMGQAICNLGDQFTPEDLDTCIPIFLDRLQNDITRLASVQALTKIAASPLAINIRSILKDSFPILASFLRKTQRDLKLSTLKLLETLMRNYNDSVTNAMILSVIQELHPLLKDSDLIVTKLTMDLVTAIADVRPAVLPSLAESFFPDLMTLLKSPLLQGAALDAILNFFEVLVNKQILQLGFQDLLSMFMSLVAQEQLAGGSNQTLHKQSLNSLSKCISTITVACPREAVTVVQDFLRDVENPKTETRHVFSLLVIGDIGRRIDVSSLGNLKSVILNSLSASSEEVKWAASYTLGSVAVGNLKEYLPFILQEIQSQTKRQYLLLLSLKETIETLSATPEGVRQLQEHVEVIWQQLYPHCEYEEEGTRNVVAECLGKLTLINPELLLPRLQQYLASDSPLMRTTVVTAIKFTISDQYRPIDPLLRQCIGQFLRTLQDPDLTARRVALVTFNTAVHNKPSLVRDLLDDILPLVYSETKVNKSLQHVVEMGPFKHTVDDHLDIRKAAFECMYTLLSSSCLDRIDIFEFLSHVETGLRDHYDIQMVTYLMLTRIASVRPHAVLQRLDKFVEILRFTIMFKMQSNLVKQDYEKQDELKRAALRVVAALLAVKDADKNPQMCDFISTIKSSPDIGPFFDAIQKDLQLKPKYSNSQY